ncbi:MAG: tryptophan--tRNA ligase [Chloroflexi bacterium]|nr:tryptophan--tRNA ligase [Chloroflexota bacterium]MCL5108321.1 tryptophan--tRNA ligase [Chloroflexota bacterium]MDA8218261.1 tryptophan--tRNA ligase [Dehalococcoidales bacterium]
MERPRILTGDRPTGRLHLGHYVGTLANRVRLQDTYQCFFIIADLHMLTTKYEYLAEVGRDVRELVLDYLAVGIDPNKSTTYLQSQVPEVTELATIFSMLVSVPRLQRVPTLKEVMRDLRIGTASLGLLSYPVLQAADILMVRASLVPVGKDQASHVEVTREIAQRFNALYGDVFPVPEALIGDVPTLPGTNGTAKMSKSLDNAIYLADDPGTVQRRVMGMYTDPTRIHSTDPGHLKGNPVFIYHDVFNPNKAEVAELKARYRAGKVGDVEVKRRLVEALTAFLAPIQERRRQFAEQPSLVEAILRQGSELARQEARRTLVDAKRAMGLDYFSASFARDD